MEVARRAEIKEGNEAALSRRFESRIEGKPRADLEGIRHPGTGRISPGCVRKIRMPVIYVPYENMLELH